MPGGEDGEGGGDFVSRELTGRTCGFGATGGGCGGPGWAAGGGDVGELAPFPSATGGGISSSLIFFPFLTEASMFSSVWKERAQG